MTRVLVAGVQDYPDYWTVDEVLSGHHHASPITCIIESNALGPERFARNWAERNGVSVVTSQWWAAPFYPDFIIAFPGADAALLDAARAIGLSVLEIVE
jgi:hypothetical protein